MDDGLGLSLCRALNWSLNTHAHVLELTQCRHHPEQSNSQTNA